MQIVMFLVAVSFLFISIPHIMMSSALWQEAAGATSSNMLDTLQAPVTFALNNKNTIPTKSIDNKKGVLQATVGPEGTTSNTLLTTEKETDYTIKDNAQYTVRNGDNLKVIAELYNLTPDTVARANNISTKTKLKVDQILNMPSIDGFPVTIKKGDTANKLAKKYDTSTQDILDFNQINVLQIGKTIYIPNGTYVEESKTTASNKKNRSTKSKSAKSNTRITFGGSYINPVPSARISSGFGPRWGRQHTGTDFAAPTGTTIKAVAAGVVEEARWRNGYGNAVMLRHPDGKKTFYAHMSSIAVSKGQTVTQGQSVGRVGSTGNSTGPHLHLEVINQNGVKVDPAKELH